MPRKSFIPIDYNERSQQNGQKDFLMKQNYNMATMIALAQKYQETGWSVIPVEYQEKRTTLSPPNKK